MTKFLGNLVSLGIAKEATRGTPESSADFWLPHMTLTLDDEIEQVIDDSAFGVIEDAVDSELTKKVAVGEFEGKVTDDSIGLLLLALFGTVSTSANDPESGVHTHTFSVQQDVQHDSLTLFINDPNQDYQHALGMLTDLTLDVALSQYARVRAGFRAKAGVADTLSPSFSEEATFLPQHGEFKTASAQSGLDGASAINIRNFSVTFEKNVEDDDVIGSNEPSDILNKRMMATGSVELVFDSEDFKTEMLADTGEAMRIELENTDETIGGATNPKLTLDFHKVKYTSFERVYENGQVVVARAEFKAHYSLTDSKMITCKLINATASY